MLQRIISFVPAFLAKDGKESVIRLAEGRILLLVMKTNTHTETKKLKIRDEDGRTEIPRWTKENRHNFPLFKDKIHRGNRGKLTPIGLIFFRK